MKKVSIVFTTSTSDSEFLFFRLGFDSINLARQSQELKTNPKVCGALHTLLHVQC